MSRSYSIFSLVTIAVVAISGAFSRTVSAIERGVAWAFDEIASAFKPQLIQPFAPGVDVIPTDYPVPSLHLMRHEAGVSRRSAARNT